MSEVEEESSCSLPEDGEEECEEQEHISFFHVQPLSLSHGYEENQQLHYTSLSLQNLQELEKSYENADLTRKLQHKSRRRFKEYAKWLDFKKPLDERRLCQAVSMNDTASVIHLLSQGVSADCHDNLRRSPLHLAACKGYTHIVRILLDAGANVNARDPIGNTPLHLAACTNHIDVVLLLLQAGSDGLSSDSLGRSPLQLAQSKLKILHKSFTTDKDLRSQVSQVIELLLMFTREGADADRLSAMRTRLSTADSRAEVDQQVQTLLDSLSDLSIT